MAWVKLDDHFFRHPKVLAAGRDARDLYLAALCYCGSGLTDGVVPTSALRILAADADIEDPERSAGRLVAAQLWEPEGDGYRVHDYHDYNPTRERVLQTREIRAEVGRRGGKQKSTNLVGGKQDFASSDSKQNSTPSRSRPTPVPVKSQIPDAGSIEPVVAAQPFALLETLCEELGTDTSVLSKHDKDKQLAAGKRLAASGLAPPELREMTRWLRAQSWVTGGVDLILIEKQIGKWRMNGRPATAAARASPYRNGRYIGLTNEELARGAGVLPDEPSRDEADFVDVAHRVAERSD